MTVLRVVMPVAASKKASKIALGIDTFPVPVQQVENAILPLLPGTQLQSQGHPPNAKPPLQAQG